MRTPDKRIASPRLEDTAVRSLSKADRARLGMDAWEPSLLRHLLRSLTRSSTERRS